MLAAVGTVAPLAFMWRTERQSRATFRWRLRGKGDGESVPGSSKVKLAARG